MDLVDVLLFNSNKDELSIGAKEKIKKNVKDFIFYKYICEMYMKISEHVNEGLKDAFQKKNKPLAKWLSFGGTILRMKKISNKHFHQIL